MKLNETVCGLVLAALLLGFFLLAIVLGRKSEPLEMRPDMQSVPVLEKADSIIVKLDRMQARLERTDSILTHMHTVKHPH